MVEQLAGKPQVARVWLFGSRARGDARERSDVDLAVEAPAADMRQWLEVCDLVDDADTLLPIDLIRMEEAPQALQQQVHAEGVILYER
ncbi:MAG TPA: nucleotidyltransferase domain-containing protein [Terriglobales bacterium]|nr:nucleotidyltransferase domain-containing protein [Terriglobales bacterium]